MSSTTQQTEKPKSKSKSRKTKKTKQVDDQTTAPVDAQVQAPASTTPQQPVQPAVSTPVVSAQPTPATESTDSTGASCETSAGEPRNVEAERTKLTEDLTSLARETDLVFEKKLEVLNENKEFTKTLMATVRELHKQVLRERKETAKIMAKLSKTNRKKKHGGNSNPGGFNIPTAISTQLCDFLGMEHGTLIPRTQVTKLVNSYILDHNLKNADNKKFIVPDQKLSQLLNMGADNQEPLTYFNLQKYMKVHYLKKDETGNLIPLVR